MESSYGFVVKFHGDRSVGVFDQEWRLDGFFLFDDKDCLDSFKKKIVAAFEECSDTPITVTSFEEIAEQESKLEQ